MAPATFHIIRCITQAAMYSLPEGPSELQGWWAVVVVVSLPTTSDSCTDCTVLHPANHLLLLSDIIGVGCCCPACGPGRRAETDAS